MESVNLDMDDIFDRDGDGDDVDNFQSALPDLPEELVPLGGDDDDNGPGLSQDAENAEVLAKLKGMKGAGKRVIRNPQPKLDGTRLTGDRGIPILPYLFKDVKFKGKGHENEDLRVIMKHMEHWAHRLFPSMPFDEVLERVEKLGNKKEVQTCIKKMRMDIPVIDKDFARDEEEVKDDDDDEDDTIRGNQADLDAEAAFDEIVREEQEQRQQSQRPPLTSLFDTPSRTAPSTPAATPSSQAATPSSQAATPDTSSQTAGVVNGLTPAQRDRMEKNKRLALERKAAKLAQQNPGQSVKPPEPSVSTADQTQDSADPELNASTDQMDTVGSERTSAPDSIHLHLSVQSDTPATKNTSSDQSSLQLPPVEESDPNSNTKTTEDSLNLHLSENTESDKSTLDRETLPSSDQTENTTDVHEGSSDMQLLDSGVLDSVTLKLNLSVDSDTEKPDSMDDKSSMCAPIEHDNSTGTVAGNRYSEPSTGVSEMSMERPSTGVSEKSMEQPSTGVSEKSMEQPSTDVSEKSMEQQSESLQLRQDVSQDSSSHSEKDADDMDTS